MTTVRPLTLDLLRPAWAAEVPSPPHDALTPEQRRQHLRRHPHSYIGVTRAPEDVDDPSLTVEDLLVEGRRSLETLLEADVFTPSEGPQYFIYRLTANGHTQTGVVCGVAVSDYEGGSVRIHERIRADRAEHLAKHLNIVGAQSSPIALATRESDRLLDVTDRAIEHEPALDFIADDELHQQVWRVTDPEVSEHLGSVLADGDLYLIDGHHRAAAAARHREHDDHQRRPGDDWMLSAVFPAHQMFNKAFHRVVDPASAARLQPLIGSGFAGRFLDSVNDVVDRRLSELAIGFANADSIRWAVIDLPLPAGPSVTTVDRLDMSRLAAGVLGPVLDIDEADPRGRLRYLPGLGTAQALTALHDELSAGEAVLVMNPVSMEDLFEVSDHGLVLPPKSTYFEPKVRSGLFVHFKDRV
ncbi:MAG: DUF1015 family protein [Acidimicrobiia bacterium]|nr:DUF1015 family protein [Acidimicrobiia bacterium]